MSSRSSKVSVQRCKVCGAFITGIFKTCINCSGLSLPFNKRGAEVIVPERNTIEQLKEVNKKSNKKLSAFRRQNPDYRNGRTRLVSAYEEIYDILDAYPRFQYPFDLQDINFDSEQALALYDLYIQEHQYLAKMCIGKTIATYDEIQGTLEHSRAAILFKYAKLFEQ